MVFNTDADDVAQFRPGDFSHGIGHADVRSREKLSFKSIRPATPLLLWLLLLPMLSMPTPKAYADIPDKAVLDELEQVVGKNGTAGLFAQLRPNSADESND